MSSCEYVGYWEREMQGPGLSHIYGRVVSVCVGIGEGQRTYNNKNGYSW